MTSRLCREERCAIVLRYDQGRQDGAHIDQWEDPKYEIYHMQDRSVPVTPGLYFIFSMPGTASSTTSGCRTWREGPPGSRRSWRRR